MAKSELDASILVENMKKIYKNKSNDEYKCRGDIKKSPNYEMLKENIDNFIPKIKGYPPQNVKILQDSLKVLERPIWAKQVGSYMAEPDDTNIIYAVYFALCYRFLFSEVMCAIVSAEATENGFVYDEDKIAEKSSSPIKILKKLSENPEKVIEHSIEQYRERTKNKSEDEIKQEAATVEGLGGAVEGVVSLVEATFGAIAKMFKSALALNPISLMSALLSRSYDKKVEKFKKFDDLYNETVHAYEDYKKIPANKRKTRIEHKYLKMIEKYNIKRDNLKKQIKHYDQRALAGDNYDDDDEVEEKPTSKKKDSKTNVKNDETKTPQTSSTVNTSDSTDDEDKKPKDDDFDF